jgi:thiol-disulfide isomerase/thioredoxin
MLFNEAGYRFGGSMTNHVVRHFYGIDQMAGIVSCALGVHMDDPFPEGFKPSEPCYCILPMHLRPGLIAAVRGLEEAGRIKGVKAIVPVHFAGDKIENWGTTRQVYCYLHVAYDTPEHLKQTVDGVLNALTVADADGRNLLYTLFNTDKLIKLLDEHRDGKYDHSRKIWTVYTFLVWYDVYFNDGYKDIEQDALYFWYQKEIQQNQDKAAKFFPTMMRIVELQTGDRYPEAVEMFFNIFSQQGNPTESNLIEMENIYRFKVKNTQKADSVHQIIIQKYPDGWTVRRQAFMDLMKAGDQWHQRSVELLTKWPSQQSAKLDAYQPYIYYNAYRALGSDYFTGQYDQQELIRMIPDMDFKTLAELYRTTCGAFHTKKAASDDLNLPVAKALIGEMQKKLTDGSYCEGIYLSPSQSDFLARRLLDEHLGNYADILLCKGQPAEALKALALITPQRRYQTPEVNETHIRALEAAGQQQKVTDVMKQAIKENAATPAMMEQLKQNYVKQHGSEQGFDAYVNSLKSQDEVQALKEEISKQFIDQPYKAFSLKDMNGNTVNSADWKGKVVVLDFWASWCFPCKNSFPGMQMAVDHFKNDPDVLFYFVDTMEHGDGYEQKARDYMKEKGFTFNVLFDAKADPKQEGNNQVVFRQMNDINHSMAIPRKMFLKDGRVRLTTEGYAGSPSKLADEVIYTVEMLKAGK